MSTNEEIKKAELDKLHQEIQNLKAEKEKTDIEREEINKRISTPFFKSKYFVQILITALTVGPLIWFYFTNAIQPVLERNKYELTRLKDSLNIATNEYKLDTAKFSEESRQLLLRLNEFDQENKKLVIALEGFQNNYKKLYIKKQ